MEVVYVITVLGIVINTCLANVCHDFYGLLSGHEHRTLFILCVVKMSEIHPGVHDYAPKLYRVWQ